jgi:hypothetical protein
MASNPVTNIPLHMASMNEVKAEITDGSDGPVTAFVMISRATEITLKERGGIRLYNPETVANALYRALVERGHLLGNDDGN